MRTLYVFALVCALAAAVASQGYTTKWDGIDLDQILASDRLLQNYFKCLMERGSCTPDGSDLKRILPDALDNDCDKCSEVQKDGSTKVIRHLRKNKPDWWSELQTKYDPQGVYAARHPEI